MINATDRDLMDADTNEPIRKATVTEAAESDEAMDLDGGCGIITVGGSRCYVEGVMVASLRGSGWSVSDPAGGVWWPSDEAQYEIERSDDPEGKALAIVRLAPERGVWGS